MVALGYISFMMLKCCCTTEIQMFGVKLLHNTFYVCVLGRFSNAQKGFIHHKYIFSFCCILKYSYIFLLYYIFTLHKRFITITYTVAVIYLIVNGRNGYV